MRSFVNWRWIALGFLFAQFDSAPAIADDSRMVEAKHLVELLHLREQLQTGKGVCTSLKETNSPEQIGARDSGYFGGIHPGDPRWSAVVKTYGDYVDEICLHPTVEESLALAQTQYAAALSETDLRAAVKFYSSPAGQNLIRGHRDVQLALAEDSKSHQAKGLSPALVEFRRKIDAILKEPRP